MENLAIFVSMRVFCAAGELRSREVCEKNGRAHGRLPTKVFGDVADGEVDRIGIFIAAEGGKTCFVRRDDKWDEGSPSWNLAL